MINIEVSAVILPAILKTAAMEGIDPKPLLKEAEISLDIQKIERASIKLESFRHFVQLLVEKSKDGAFALRLGENFAFEYLPDIQTYIATCSSLRETGRTFFWIKQLISPVLNISFEEEGEFAHLKLIRPSEDLEFDTHIHNESLVAAITKFTRYLLGNRFKADRINFDHKEPAYREVYDAMFDVPLYFNQPSTEIIFSAALLDMPLSGSLPLLNQQAAARVEAQLKLPKEAISYTDRLLSRWLLRPDLLDWTIEEAAVSLFLSPRTLQRKLKEETTCYGNLQDQARLHFAIMLFKEGKTVENVSETMRFSDRRSFTRAFKRWTGLSPRQYLDKFAVSRSPDAVNKSVPGD
jgi:AraC-like DNA-binding protein